MAAVAHNHGGHKKRNVTKKLIRKVLFISQNVRGLKSDNRLEELFAVMNNRNVF